MMSPSPSPQHTIKFATLLPRASKRSCAIDKTRLPCPAKTVKKNERFENGEEKRAFSSFEPHTCLVLVLDCLKLAKNSFQMFLELLCSYVAQHKVKAQFRFPENARIASRSSAPCIARPTLNAQTVEFHQMSKCGVEFFHFQVSWLACYARSQYYYDFIFPL